MSGQRVLLGSVVVLAVGLSLIFGYCHGTVGFSAASSLAGCSLQVAITTTGTPALFGVALTLAGLVLLMWAAVDALLAQVQSPAPTSKRESHPAT
jgi:hypothetical protein